MIFTVESVDQGKYPELIDEMFRMRAEVFHGRLGWDVKVENGREIDIFDAEDPLYLLALSEKSGELQGAVRLLPTTGPNMLRDVFPMLIPDGAVESPLIWESSRFAVNPRVFQLSDRQTANHRLNRTMVELLCGMVEVAQSAGVEYIVSVFDARMARIFKSIDCRFEQLGTPRRIGKTMTYAGLFETNDDMRSRLGKVGGFQGVVLADVAPRAEAATSQMANAE